MRLFVAEKPAAAGDIAAYLAKKAGVSAQRQDKFIKVGNDVVIAARGHLLEQCEPDEYFTEIVKTSQNSKNGRLYWSVVPLPILPKKFLYRPSNSDKDRSAQLSAIGKLMKEADTIFNCADLDREGQLIFDEIIEYFGIKGKPIKRVLFSALDDKSLDRAFASVIDNDQPSMRNRGLAAKARGQADWLAGFNGTRAMSLAHGKKEFGVLNIGRVMTPTCSIVVMRQLDILNFKSIAFYTPVIELSDGTILEWKRRRGERCAGFDDDGRIIDSAVAKSIIDAINNGMDGIITESKSIEKSKQPPMPFSLPSIQSELSRKHGLTIDQITAACQKLYDKKMQTYVGTDCRFLPEAMHGEARDVLAGLRNKFSGLIDGVSLDRKYDCWNDGKMTGDGAAAHHGIIPTGKIESLDSEDERIVFEAVCRRYIAQFHPEYRYLSVQLQASFGADDFAASTTSPLSMGWKLVDSDESDTTENNTDKLTQANKMKGV